MFGTQVRAEVLDIVTFTKATYHGAKREMAEIRARIFWFV